MDVERFGDMVVVRWRENGILKARVLEGDSLCDLEDSEIIDIFMKGEGSGTVFLMSF